jgi:hypothetical protein
MSDAEREQVKAWLIKATFSIVAACFMQVMAFVWFISKLDSKVAEIDADVRTLVPRVETLERDYWKRGGNAQ